jgi:hypothetical protein
MHWSLVLLLPTLAFAAPVPKVKENPPPFPMTVGDTRVYEYRTEDRADEANSDVVTQVEKQKDGSTHVTLSVSIVNGVSYKTVIAVADTGLTRLALSEKTLAKPPLLLKLPATVGTKWEAGDAKYEVIGEEEVEVTAGKYKAAKVVVTNGIGKTTLWFAPGVGMVKSAGEGNDRVLVLKEFKPGK